MLYCLQAELGFMCIALAGKDERKSERGTEGWGVDKDRLINRR